jgi:hypothetical protein
MKKSLILIGCTVFTIGLAGCAANNDNAANDRNGEQQVQTLDVDRGPANQGGQLRVADRIERQVEQMQDVEDAHVIISDNKAYVAVRLAENAGNRNNRNIAGNGMDDNGNANVNDALDGNAGTFAENGRINQGRNRAGDNGIIDGKGDAGIENRQNAGTADSNIFGADNDRGNDNYYSQATNAFEYEIEDKVRNADKDVKDVYISVDNNVYNRMGTFADDIRNDRNRNGIFEDFTDTVNDLFRR